MWGVGFGWGSSLFILGDSFPLMTVASCCRAVAVGLGTVGSGGRCEGATHRQLLVRRQEGKLLEDLALHGTSGQDKVEDHLL